VFFSPVASEHVPDDAYAIWLPGGYPELYAQQLSESTSWDSLHIHAETGTPILAECGGAMLLGDRAPFLEPLPELLRIRSDIPRAAYRT
ncbi:MAG: cobyrinate a,c-diamide synthase, partial [Methyloglobulus sp.]|nr:cobyrinate a,c-diamide synthase [Methyloglobulus sp.]